MLYAPRMHKVLRVSESLPLNNLQVIFCSSALIEIIICLKYISLKLDSFILIRIFTTFANDKSEKYNPIILCNWSSICVEPVAYHAFTRSCERGGRKISEWICKKNYFTNKRQYFYKIETYYSLRSKLARVFEYLFWNLKTLSRSKLVISTHWDRHLSWRKYGRPPPICPWPFRRRCWGRLRSPGSPWTFPAHPFLHLYWGIRQWIPV